MAKEKPGVMIYWETFDAFEAMPDSQLKTLITSIRQYAQYGVVPNFEADQLLFIVWQIIKPRLDADGERYERISAARVEAGRAGGKASAESRKQKEANEAIATFDKQINPTTTTTTTTTTDTTTDRGIREKDKGEREKGQTASGPSYARSEAEFEAMRQKSLDMLEALRKGGVTP